MPEQDCITTASAPGKIILSGEHAVVYGSPAIAFAVDRFATTTITKTAGITKKQKRMINFIFLNDKLNQAVSLQELCILKAQVDERYLAYKKGILQIKGVIKSPLELIEYAFIYLVENIFPSIFHTEDELEIKLNLTLPLGCGMGASAAVTLSLIYALASYSDETLSVDRYLYFGKEIENLQHGSSSGLDLFVSLYGGSHFFANGESHKRHLPKFPFLLVNTGKPKTSTGECVIEVAKHFMHSTLADDFAEITIALDQALRKNDLKTIKESVSNNHKLLMRIGVVPKKVADFITKVSTRGNSAKISGAGAIYGTNAGVILVIGEENISDIIAEYGYASLPVKEEPSGIRIL